MLCPVTSTSMPFLIWEKQVFRLVFVDSNNFFMSCSLLSVSQAAAAEHDLSSVLNITEVILSQHPSPTSYGLLLSPAWCWSCQQSSERREAGNRAEKTCKRLSSIARQTDGEWERARGDGLESTLDGALRQSLNKAGEKARNTERGESKRAAGPGLPRTHRQLLLDCLLESDRAATHISTPLPYTLFSSEKWPPISPSPLRKPPIQSLSFFYLSNHTGPGAFCYLVTGPWIRRNTSLRAPLWPRPLEWIFNIWLDERQTSIIL